MQTTLRTIQEAGLGCQWIEPRPAAREVIELVHPPEYVDAIRDYSDGTQARNDDYRLVNADTALSSNSYHLAALGVGAECEAIDAIMEGRARNAFLLVRPGDHHAYPARAGVRLCLFNFTAVGARYAQRRHGLERVLMPDWDVHHGNGTQATFYSDPSVYFYSIHQFGGFSEHGARD